MSFPILLLAQVSVLVYAVLGGVFLAFSDFLMRALDRTGGAGGVAAMQSINREVFRWVVIPLFMVMVPVSLVFLGVGLWRLDAPGGPLVALAGAVYLVGCFGVTAVCNVPMNQALARLDGASEAARTYWSATYLPRWTFWNTLRTGACLAAAALLFIGVS